MRADILVSLPWDILNLTMFPCLRELLPLLPGSGGLWEAMILSSGFGFSSHIHSIAADMRAWADTQLSQAQDRV